MSISEYLDAVGLNFKNHSGAVGICYQQGASKLPHCFITISRQAGDTCQIEILRGKEKIPVEVTFFETKGHGKK